MKYLSRVILVSLFIFSSPSGTYAEERKRDRARPLWRQPVGERYHRTRNPEHYKSTRQNRFSRWYYQRHLFHRQVDSYWRASGHRGIALIGFSLLADQNSDFDYMELQDNMELEDKENIYDEFQVAEVRITVLGNGAKVDFLTVRFCESFRWGPRTQSFLLDTHIKIGQSTRWLSLVEAKRCIEGFSVTGRGDNDSDNTILVLEGKTH